MNANRTTARAELFSYVGLDVNADSLIAHYELDGRAFSEVVTFDRIGPLTTPAVTAVAHLWYLLAGLSYYKAGAAARIDLGHTPVGPAGRALLRAALVDGLGEFSFCNNLDLDDVKIEGGTSGERYSPDVDISRVLVPFGGGIDSVVTLSELSDQLDQTLFVVSPVSGTFAPLEETALVTGLPIVRATRALDPQILSWNDEFLNGHVPVTAMVTMLAVIAALATRRGGVVMSNEHSSSIPNLRWHGRDINHQWSKSWTAETLIADAVAEIVGDTFVVASYLRDRSEVWVAQAFSELTRFHHVFRSCNRAFAQLPGARATTWCGECDKCLFTNLILAPFLSRADLREIFDAEPLSDVARKEQLRTLVGLGVTHKPFECVGDPDESAVALTKVSTMREWSDVEHLAEIAQLVSPNRDFDELLASQGASRVPAHWLR
jgi:hypothetical protein